jgi:hypothetical protein
MLFHPVKNRSCVLDFWDGKPPPPAAQDAGSLGPQDKIERVGFERLASAAKRIGLGGTPPWLHP